MAKLPTSCPSCNAAGFKQIDTNKKGFSVGKAAAGAVLLGPLGLLGGGLGKKHVTMHCSVCGFTHEYKK